MTTGQLENLLYREPRGWETHTLRNLYLICTMLSERAPENGTPREVSLCLCAAYADQKTVWLIRAHPENHVIALIFITMTWWSWPACVNFMLSNLKIAGG